jgi:replicative DNA helicase
MGVGIMNLPFSTEAESSLLGIMLFETELIDEIIPQLEADDFYHIENREIYQSITDLKKASTNIDPITIMDNLNSRKIKVVEFQDITRLISSIVSTSNYQHYTKIVKERSAQRKLIKIAAQLQGKAEGNISETIQQAVADIQALQMDDATYNGYVPELIDEVIAKIKENSKSGKIAGIPTGFCDLDKFTGGWQGGRYYILGARPKMGKTSLFCQLADIAASKTPVVIFSLEMSKEELIKLLIYQNSKVDSMLEQSGKLTSKEFKEMQEAIKDLKQKPIYIDDKSRSMAQINASLKKAQKIFDKQGKGKIGLIVLDYVQMIHGDKRMQRNYQLEEISRGLKELAKDYNLCVLALSQLSREVEQRPNKKPIPSDLRDSGSFEQDCDGLMLMYRDSYYNKQSEENTVRYKYNQSNILVDIVDINFFLNRHGAAGKLQIDFATPFRVFFNHGNNEVLKPSDVDSFYISQEKMPWDDEGEE